MAETNPKKPAAADKRKEADAALEKRIAERKASIKKDAAANPIPAPVPVTAPAEQLPFHPATPAPTLSSAPAKKARKPRTPKLMATPDAELADLLKTAQDKAVKAATKELESKHAAILKGTVDKTYHDNEVKKAYEKGVADGKKSAIASLKATLKGGA